MRVHLPHMSVAILGVRVSEALWACQSPVVYHQSLCKGLSSPPCTDYTHQLFDLFPLHTHICVMMVAHCHFPIIIIHSFISPLIL